MEGQHQQQQQQPESLTRNKVGLISSSSTRKEEWSDNGVFCLLEMYGDKYSTLRRGSLSSRDWEDLAVHVNRHCRDVQALKTSDQCKYKIENMKRRYKMEKAKIRASAGGKIVWPFFCKMDQILAGAAPNILPPPPIQQQQQQQQLHGIPGGIDAGTATLLLQTEGNSITLDCFDREQDEEEDDQVAEESQAESESPSLVNNKSSSSKRRPKYDDIVNIDESSSLLRRKKKKKKKNNKTQQQLHHLFPSSDLLGKEVANSIRGFAEVMLKIEQAKIDLIRDLERERAANELKRTQMLLAGQREIVKLLGGKDLKDWLGSSPE